MFRGTRTRILWDDRTRLVQSTVGKLGEFRIKAKKVNKEQITDYLGKTVEGYVKWKLREKYSVEIQEKHENLCVAISKAVEDISKAVLNHHIVAMFTIKWMVKNLIELCDLLVYAATTRLERVTFYV